MNDTEHPIELKPIKEEIIPIEENDIEEPEPIAYIEDLKYFLSSQSTIDHQIFLNDLPKFLNDNPNMEKKFVDFFDEEFQKQLALFEVYEKLEESYSNPDIKKIVPQISFLFSCPNLIDDPLLKKHLRDSGDAATRSE